MEKNEVLRYKKVFYNILSTFTIKSSSVTSVNGAVFYARQLNGEI